MGETMGVFLIGAILFGIVLAILWLAVPFILMTTNRRLDKIIEILRDESEGTGSAK